MLRAGSKLCLEAFKVSINQTRGKKLRLRKPRWMPKAPSKLFKIYEQKPVDEEEQKQIKFIEDRYYNEIKSIR